MGIEGQNVGNAHIDQFMQGHRAVQALSACPAVLTAFIQEGHDDVDALCFAGHGGDDSLEVLEMIVGGHGNGLPVHLISDVVGADIHDDIDVIAADAFFQDAFGFPGPEPGTGGLDQERIPVPASHGIIVFVLNFHIVVPFLQPGVYALTDIFTSSHRDDAERTVGDGIQINTPICGSPAHLHHSFLLKAVKNIGPSIIILFFP